MFKPATEAEKKTLGCWPLTPHPDGKPWDKCCGSKNTTSCMCLMRKPKYGQSRFDTIMGANIPATDELKNIIAEDGRFFCVHRLDGIYNRECAGWAAKFGHRVKENNDNSQTGEDGRTDHVQSGEGGQLSLNLQQGS